MNESRIRELFEKWFKDYHKDIDFSNLDNWLDVYTKNTYVGFKAAMSIRYEMDAKAIDVLHGLVDSACSRGKGLIKQIEFANDDDEKASIKTAMAYFEDILKKADKSAIAAMMEEK